MAHGGKRPGTGGRRPGAGRQASEARQYMREIAADPLARANALEYARTHPDFWLKCFEAGHGRPPQALDVSVKGPPFEHRVTFTDGHVVPATIAGLSEGGASERGEG